MIGDPYQLAPVGAGLVLHELVEKKYLPISKLSVVKRQGNHSSIPKVAESIRNGQVPKVYGDNVEFHNVDKSHLADKAILEYVKFPKESQILCATNKLVSEVNKKAQTLLNPNEAEVIYSLEGLKYRTNLRLRDPVICTSNIYREEYDLRNGSMEVIVEVYNTPKSFDIRKNVKSKIFVTIATYGKIRWDDGTDSGYITELPLEIIQSIQPVSYTHLRAHETPGLGDVYKRQVYNLLMGLPFTNHREASFLVLYLQQRKLPTLIELLFILLSLVLVNMW